MSLINAIHSNNLHQLKLLLELGMTLNMRNDSSITPLIEAVKNNANKLAELLLEKGADPSVRDRDGYTALDYARLYKNEALIMMIKKYQSEQFI
jgi:uncharacterized protein